MCGMCGLLGNSQHWANQAAGTDTALSRRNRLIQISMANRILKKWRMSLSDFHGQYFVLANATGAQAIVSDYTQIWKSCEEMLKKPLDPLTLFQKNNND